MKALNKLPGLLRSFFAFLRMMTLVLAVFWIGTMIYNGWIQKRTGHDGRLMATVGEIALPGPIGLGSDTATSGSLILPAVRGDLRADLASNDAALSTALRLAIIPSMAVLIVFAYLLFTLLRNLCGNLARGDVFNEANLRAVRLIGINLIVYSILGVVMEAWASHVLAGYFQQHVSISGLQATLPFSSVNSFQFSLPASLVTAPGGILIGFLVLAVAEAFRQGLNLKTENDLTV